VPAHDLYHDAVKNALIKDGWTITDDPFMLSYGNEEVYADLGAERAIGAEKKDQKIVVEIKSFIGKSAIKDLRDAIGQYVMYREILVEAKSERILYLAVSEDAFKSTLDTKFGRLFIEREKIKVIVFDPESEVIRKWFQI